MGQLTAATAAPDQIEYLDKGAQTKVGRDYKQRLITALNLQPGHRVVDLGCGPGTDLRSLADAVGSVGSVIGIDQDPRMLDQARQRLADRSNVELHQGDIHELPFPDSSVDRVRVDRVLQHVDEPEKVIAEVRRVLRPGGLFALAEPDWDTLAVADEDIETSRRFARYTADRVRNNTLGRQLPRLCLKAGLQVRSIDPIPAMFADFPTADLILGLRRNAARAVLDGVIPEADAEAWVGRLENGPVLAGFTFYLVIAQQPAP